MKNTHLVFLFAIGILLASCQESFIGNEGIIPPPKKIPVFDLFFTSYDSNGTGTINCYSTRDTVVGKVLYTGGVIYSPPAGGHIVFILPDKSNQTIMLMNEDGSRSHAVLTVDDLQFLVLSPDGKTILYALSQDPSGSLDLYTMSLDGLNQVKLCSGILDDVRPVFSHNGKFVAAVKLETSPGKGDELFMFPVGGGTPRSLAKDKFGAPFTLLTQSVVWSFDDSKMYYSKYDHRKHLYEVNVLSGQKQEIDCAGDIGGGMAASPDGSSLVYADGSGELYSFDLYSHSDIRLTFTSKLIEQNPDIDSSATRIVYRAYRFGAPSDSAELRIYDRSSGITSKVANGVYRAFWKK